MRTVVQIRVDNRIRVPLPRLPAEARVALRAACEHENPEFKKRRAQGFATYNVPPIIRTWREEQEPEELTLPRGAMARTREILRDLRLPFRVEDARCEGAPLLRPLEYVGHRPRDYQLAGARRCEQLEQGVVRAATGSGKTTTALYAASLFGLNTLVVVPTVKLMQQTAEVAEKLLGLRGSQIGIVGDGTWRIRPLTIATQQTLWSRSLDAEVREFFGAVVVDEAHHAAARTFQEVIDAFPARYRIAFTADERRKDRKEFLVYDAFGQPIHEMTREACEELGVVLDVEVRVVFSDFEAPWYRYESDFNRLLDEMTGCEARNELIAEVAREELDAGEQVIVCTHRREHVRALGGALAALGFPSGTMLGGADASDARDFEQTRAGLRDGTVLAGVGTYGALGEGIDLPAVAVGIAATPITSNKQKFNQYRGRLCRPSAGKTQGRLYVVFDRRVFDERAFANILAWNRTVRVRRGGKWVDARGMKRGAIMAA